MTSRSGSTNNYDIGKVSKVTEDMMRDTVIGIMSELRAGTKSSSPLVTKTDELLIGLKKEARRQYYQHLRIQTMEDVRVSIGIAGRYIKVIYDGQLPDNGVVTGTGNTGELVMYRRSNEVFDKDTYRAVNGLHGIEHFIGVVGGANYAHSLVFALLGRNPLKDCMLVDIAVNQCFHGMVVALCSDNYLQYGYDRSTAPRDAVSESIREGYRLAPMTLEFRNEDILSAINGVSKAGKYLIYPSNTYTLSFDQICYIRGFSELDASCLLEPILEKCEIEPGSHVILTKADSGDFMLLRKEERSFSVVTTRFGDDQTGSEERKAASFKRYISGIVPRN